MSFSYRPTDTEPLEVEEGAEQKSLTWDKLSSLGLSELEQIAEGGSGTRVMTGRWMGRPAIIKGVPVHPWSTAEQRASLDNEVVALRHLSQSPDCINTINCLLEMGEIDCLQDVLQVPYRVISKKTHRVIILKAGKGIDILSPDNIGPDNIGRILKTLVHTLAYIHSKDIAHSDIKEDNIIIGDDGIPMFIDFGSACSPRGSVEGLVVCKTGQQSRTLELMAPEVRAGKVDPNAFFAADVWSLAVTLYRMLWRDPSSWMTRPEELILFDSEESKRARGRVATDERIPAKIRFAIWAMMNPDWKDRPTAAELAAFLNNREIK